VTDICLATTSTTITVEIITACDATELLMAAVENSSLRRQVREPLTASLESACDAFNRGSTGAGLNELNTFQNEVNAMVARTDPALATQLISLAQQVSDGVNAQLGH
jgi:hypothetical protein